MIVSNLSSIKLQFFNSPRECRLMGKGNGKDAEKSEDQSLMKVHAAPPRSYSRNPSGFCNSRQSVPSLIPLISLSLYQNRCLWNSQLPFHPNPP